jgi:hypothetical protein
MEILRAPDERFEHLPGYPFELHYVEVDGLRMHYADWTWGWFQALDLRNVTLSYLERKEQVRVVKQTPPGNKPRRCFTRESIAG